MLLALAVLAVPGQAQAQAQAYPSRPIKLISPLAAGGTGDTLARLFGAQLAKILGQPVVVHALPGAGGQIGFEAVAKSPPDGYTLAIASPALVIIPLLRRNAGFETSDFLPVTMFATTSQLVVVNASSPFKTLRELLAFAKANPGKLNYGSSGTGSATHLNMELIKQMAGVSMVHIPYRGSTPARQALLAYEVDLLVDGLLPAMPLIKDGRFRALGMVDSTRSDVALEIPTIAEAGVPGYGSDTWYGLVVPAGTPKEIIDRLQAAALEATKTAELRNALMPQGIKLSGNTSAEFQAFLEREKTRWTSVIKFSGTKAD